MTPTGGTLRALLGFELDSALRILENVNRNLRSYGYSLPVGNADLNKVVQETTRALRIVQDLRSTIDTMQGVGSPLSSEVRSSTTPYIVVDFDAVSSDGLILCPMSAVPSRLLVTPEVAVLCEDGKGRSALARIIRVDERRFMVWLRIVATTVHKEAAPTERLATPRYSVRR